MADKEYLDISFLHKRQREMELENSEAQPSQCCDLLSVGDVVRPADGYALRSGGQAYSVAIVLQVEPALVLVSLPGDMRWEQTIQGRNFIVVEKASREEYEAVKHRLDG